MTGRLLVLCLLAFTATVADAQTRYVSDRLEITLRSGTSTQHSIVRMLPSGARLEVLETDAAAGYSRVRTADGVEGWVLTRYLMDQPAARDRVAAAINRVENLNAREAELTAQVAALSEERDSLQTERDGLRAELEEVAAELERIRRVSASAVELDKANRELRTRLAAAEQSGDGLRADLSELKRNTQRDWFLAGAGVLIAGLVLGLILPRLRVRRRSGWGDL
ncbi:MAG: TIGR04211 family SH3 domain-containing protein [Gammaproteobacteria bacterium]